MDLPDAGFCRLYYTMLLKFTNSTEWTPRPFKHLCYSFVMLQVTLKYSNFKRVIVDSPTLRYRVKHLRGHAEGIVRTMRTSNNFGHIKRRL